MQKNNIAVKTPKIRKLCVFKVVFDCCIRNVSIHEDQDQMPQNSPTDQGPHLVLLVKRNTPSLYSHFHRTFMCLLLMSVAFFTMYRKRG